MSSGIHATKNIQRSESLKKKTHKKKKKSVKEGVQQKHNQQSTSSIENKGKKFITVSTGRTMPMGEVLSWSRQRSQFTDSKWKLDSR